MVHTCCLQKAPQNVLCQAVYRAGTHSDGVLERLMIQYQNMYTLIKISVLHQYLQQTPVTAEMNKIQTFCTERHIIPYTTKHKVLISFDNYHSLLPASTPPNMWESWVSTLH